MINSIENLIIVPGHAAFKAEVLISKVEDPGNDEYWVLQDFQKGEPNFYVQHIEAGVNFAKEDKTNLLLFSGGRSRHEAGGWSEALTYYCIAKHNNYWTERNSVAERIHLEEYARDSFENLEFSLYRYYDIVKNYPTHVYVVGWKFKQSRFEFHAKTLGISCDFTYIGCNNPADLAAAENGESKTLKQFYDDPRGESGELSKKRLDRNPLNLNIPYTNMPEIRCMRHRSFKTIKMEIPQY